MFSSITPVSIVKSNWRYSMTKKIRRQTFLLSVKALCQTLSTCICTKLYSLAFKTSFSVQLMFENLYYISAFKRKQTYNSHFGYWKSHTFQSDSHWKIWFGEKILSWTFFFPQRSRCHQLSCRITLLQTFKNKPDCSCAISVFIHNPADHVITSALNFANNTSLRYVLFKGSKYRQQKYQMETQL